MRHRFLLLFLISTEARLILLEKTPFEGPIKSSKHYQFNGKPIEETFNKKRRLKILVNTWTHSYSHMKFQMDVAGTLSDAGHEVVCFCLTFIKLCLQ